MVSGTCALLKQVGMKLRGEQGSGPKGVDDLCFHTYGEFSPIPSPPPPPHPPLPTASRPISQPECPYPSLEAQIPVLRPKSIGTGIWALGLGVGPSGCDLGHKTGIWVSEIWASKLRYGPGGWGDGGYEKGEEDGGENSPYV